MKTRRARTRSLGDPDLQISTYSSWGDAVWLLDKHAQGSVPSSYTVKWNFRLPDGSLFSDRHHDKMTFQCKSLFFFLINAEEHNCRQLSASSIVKMTMFLRVLIVWMIDNEVSSFADLTQELLEDYLVFIKRLRPARVFSRKSNSKGYFRQVGSLQIVLLIWDFRKAFSDCGITLMRDAPWRGRSLSSILGRSAPQTTPIMPIPTDVVIPILNTAARFIEDTIVNDVLKLADIYLGIRDAETDETLSKESFGSRQRKARLAVSKFIFSTFPGERDPWHRRLVIGSSSRLVIELRHLILDVSAAATTLIYAGVGLRGSEICSVRSGTNPRTYLPNSVRLEVAFSGLYDLFLLDAKVLKGVKTPAAHAFNAGMRLAGATEDPIVVRAIKVLERIWSRWRDPSSDLLLVRFERTGFPPEGKFAPKASVKSIDFDFKDFVSRRVDFDKMPDTSDSSKIDQNLLNYIKTKGRCIRLHQFRKNLAHFVLQTYPNLLPVLSAHFRHYGISLTEQKYGHDSFGMSSELYNVREQLTAQRLLELTDSTPIISGNIGDRIGRLKEQVEALTGSDRRASALKKLTAFVAARKLLIWEAPHGNCLPLEIAEMRCHNSAGTAADTTRQPNFSHRSVKTCLGCPSFMIDTSHIPYWKDRYLSHARSLQYLQSRMDSATIRVVEERTRQARLFLSRLGVNIDELDRLLNESC